MEQRCADAAGNLPEPGPDPGQGDEAAAISIVPRAADPSGRKNVPTDHAAGRSDAHLSDSESRPTAVACWSGAGANRTRLVGGSALPVALWAYSVTSAASANPVRELRATSLGKHTLRRLVQQNSAGRARLAGCAFPPSFPTRHLERRPTTPEAGRRHRARAAARAGTPSTRHPRPAHGDRARRRHHRASARPSGRAPRTPGPSDQVAVELEAALSRCWYARPNSCLVGVHRR